MPIPFSRVRTSVPASEAMRAVRTGVAAMMSADSPAGIVRRAVAQRTW